jgi:hypothetical protein
MEQVDQQWAEAFRRALDDVAHWKKIAELAREASIQDLQRRQEAEAQLLTQSKELAALYAKAKLVACDFIGYPTNAADQKAIDDATPMKAIEALEWHLRNDKRF